MSRASNVQDSFTNERYGCFIYPNVMLHDIAYIGYVMGSDRDSLYIQQSTLAKEGKRLDMIGPYGH